MPVKLIGFILTLLIIISFIGFNIENSSDIRIWFGDKGLLTEVPIFVSFFIMYLLGVLSVVPFLIGWKRKKNDSRKSNETDDDDKTEGTKKSVRVLGARKRRKKMKESLETDDDDSGVTQTDEETVQGADLS